MFMSEELQQLSETAQGLAKEFAGPKAFRDLRAANPAEGVDLPFWNRMAELGWLGIAIPEALGGYDMGTAAVVSVADALGANLASTPFATTAVFAARALSAGAAGGVGTDRLPPIAEGRAIYAIAIDEGPRHRGLDGIEMTATPDGDGFVLFGAKRNVLDFDAAQSLLVVARAEAGLTAFAVPKETVGVSATTTTQLDVRRASTIGFEGVRVDGTHVVGSVGDGEGVVAAALETARLAVAAEMLGAAKAVFDMTVEYMRDRKQFGVPIGSFQALQHRAAHVHTELTIAGAAVRRAASHLTTNDVDAPAAVAAAKSKVGRVAILAANEAIQMHGGVGVTDEFDVGLYVKRIRTLENLFGDRLYHGDRFARLRGF